jgi:ADP-ribosylglycohydrolase
MAAVVAVNPEIVTYTFMIGVIAGDVIGSRFEWRPIKTIDFPLFHPLCRFTDDTVLTVATASAILEAAPFDERYLDFGRRYPRAGYGGNFHKWLAAIEPRPYNSYGNGSAMRVAPVGWACADERSVLREAERSAAVTHNHPEGVKGAQATALAVFMARRGASKDEIRAGIASRFGYDLNRTIDQIRPTYHFDVTCQGTVPEALIAFFESTDYESAVRLAISLGGDSDTLAAITGGVAHAFYRVMPDPIIQEVRGRLPEEFLRVLDEFEGKFGVARRDS